MNKKFVSICLLAASVSPVVARANPGTVQVEGEPGTQADVQNESQYQRWAKKGAKVGAVSGACVGFAYGTHLGVGLAGNTHFKTGDIRLLPDEQAVPAGYHELVIDPLSYAVVPACGALGGILGGVAGGLYGGLAAGGAGIATVAMRSGAEHVVSFYESLRTSVESYRQGCREISEKKGEENFLLEVEKFLEFMENHWLSPSERIRYRHPRTVVWPYSDCQQPVSLLVSMTQYELDKAYLLERYKLDVNKGRRSNADLLKGYMKQRYTDKLGLTEFSKDEGDLISAYLDATMGVISEEPEGSTGSEEDNSPTLAPVSQVEEVTPDHTEDRAAAKDDGLRLVGMALSQEFFEEFDQYEK